jgi:hypothetical protein
MFAIQIFLDPNCDFQDLKVRLPTRVWLERRITLPLSLSLSLSLLPGLASQLFGGEFWQRNGARPQYKPGCA